MTGKEKLIYLAGILDGEGSITVDRSPWTHTLASGVVREYVMHRLSIRVTNSNFLLMLWLKRNFGGSYCEVKRTGERQKKHSRSWQWSTYSRKAERLLKAVSPYLLLKKRQAELGISLYRIPHSHRRWFEIPKSVFRKRECLRVRMSKLNRRFRKVPYALRPAIPWNQRITAKP